MDEKDKEPVAFANILFDDNIVSGTNSDIDGIFKVPKHVQKITISYVGYETLTLVIDQLESNTILLNQK